MSSKLFYDFFERRIANAKLPLARKFKNTYSIGEPFTTSSLKEEVIKKQFSRLKSAFNLSDVAQTYSRFEMATSGVEWKEINQLNSSALLAFLCFHKINKTHQISIPRIGKFNNVYFEIKSPLAVRAKSNMDVVLTNDDTVLFLESKFSEYLNPTKTYNASIAYDDYYKQILGANLSLGDISICATNGKCLWTCPTGKHAYLEGLKQLISHTLGICNTLAQQQPLKSWDVAEGNLSNKKHFILAEILFRFEDDTEPNGPFASYARYYPELRDKLNAYIKRQELAPDKDFHIHNTILTYQDIFKGNINLLNKTISNFYF